ncbi:14776_t:CDS:2 [Funneliformis mosseae]|uniref:14776_t:CDS:1 n=1 Tax=Funneliformis mosseae TaxID=27381 RepID=A0A9N9E995_FUNMO|nr:14776_t:CDS:2 [Funneliformis mosseae]
MVISISALPSKPVHFLVVIRMSLWTDPRILQLGLAPHIISAQTEGQLFEEGKKPKPDSASTSVEKALETEEQQGKQPEIRNHEELKKAPEEKSEEEIYNDDIPFAISDENHKEELQPEIEEQRAPEEKSEKEIYNDDIPFAISDDVENGTIHVFIQTPGLQSKEGLTIDIVDCDKITITAKFQTLIIPGTIIVNHLPKDFSLSDSSKIGPVNSPKAMVIAIPQPNSPSNS